MPRPTEEELTLRFSHHKPTAYSAHAHDEWRRAIRACVDEAVDVIPAGRELALVLTKLEEAMFHGNAGIARHEAVDPVEERAKRDAQG